MTLEEIRSAARDIEYAAVELDTFSSAELYMFRRFVESKLLEAAGNDVPVVPGD